LALISPTIGGRSAGIVRSRTQAAEFLDTDHYLVVAKVRERLAVNKQRTHRFHTERFNLKKLHEVEGKKQYRVEVSNRVAALETIDGDEDINSAWRTD
jgi:hypothetical protein